MANGKRIKILSLRKKTSGGVRLNLRLGSEQATYDVSVVDRNGIFGLELPDSLGLKLRDFSPEESRNLVELVKHEYARKLRAA
jgi:hypothetical protein